MYHTIERNIQSNQIIYFQKMVLTFLMIVLVDLPGPGARENPRSVVFQIDFSFNKFQKRKFIWIYVVLSKDRVDEHTISSVELARKGSTERKKHHHKKWFSS